MILISIFLSTMVPIFSQNKLIPLVDERFELMSIVAHYRL